MIQVCGDRVLDDRMKRNMKKMKRKRLSYPKKQEVKDVKRVEINAQKS